MGKDRFGFLSVKTLNKIISVVIAMLLWAYVIAEINPVTQQTMIGIPVKLINSESISERGLALSGGQEFTVDVVLEGKRRDMVQIAADEILASADLFGFGKGENTLKVSIAAPEGMTVVEVRPSKIKVNIEELITATRPVEISYAGEPPEGFEPGGILLNPAEIEITGAESAVSAVASIRATVNMEDLSTEQKTIQIRPVAVDSSGEEVKYIDMSSTSVNVAGRLLPVKEVKLEVEFTGSLDPIYDIKYIDVPESISIKGDAALIADVASIKAEPIDISALTGTKTIALVPILPEGIELASSSGGIQAKIGVQELASKTFAFTADEIEARDVGDGLRATVNTEKITVTASGSGETIDTLTKGDIVPYVDLAGKTAGVGSYQIVLDCGKDLDTLASDPATVYVTVSAGN